jgi:hypothetical protein
MFFLLVGCGPRFNTLKLEQPVKTTGTDIAKFAGHFDTQNVNVYVDDLPKKECTVIATGEATKRCPGVICANPSADNLATHASESLNANTVVMGNMEEKYVGTMSGYDSNTTMHANTTYGNNSASTIGSAYTSGSGYSVPQYITKIPYLIANCK